MMRRLIAVLVLAAAACATTSDPAQMAWQAKAGYAVALQQAVNYRELPECGKQPQGSLLCHDPDILKQTRLAQAAAKPALDAAEAAVTGGNLSVELQMFAVRAAQAALESFQKVLEKANGGAK